MKGPVCSYTLAPLSVAVSTIFSDSLQTIKLVIAEGNLVAAWTTYEGPQQGPMGPFPPSRRKARFDFGAVFCIVGGKIGG